MVATREFVLIERAEGMATITLNRPEARNALPLAAWEQLHNALTDVGGDPAVKVVIITGTEGSFAAGDDMKEVGDVMQGAYAGQRSMMDVRDITLLIQKTSLDIVNMPKPVIAAVNGWALGAGFELVLICDFAYAAESARFGFPEASLGMTITGGITQVISRIIPLPQAKELAFTARKIDANTAKQLGLVNQVLPDAELMAAVRATAREIMRNSPVAVSFLKKSLQLGTESSLAQAIGLETEMILAMLATQDVREGITAFKEKRTPEFPGR